MGLTVATQEALTELIQERIKKRIEEIRQDDAQVIAAAKQEARIDLLAKTNTADKCKRWDEINRLLAALSEEKQALAREMEKHFPTPAGVYNGSWVHGLERAVNRRAEVIYQTTEGGQRVAELEKAKDDLQMIVLTATSNRQLDGLIGKLNSIIGYEPSEFEKAILS